MALGASGDEHDQERPPVSFAIARRDDAWFAFAWETGGLVATAVGGSREHARAGLIHCLPESIDAAEVSPDSDPAPVFTEALSALERGISPGMRLYFSAYYLGRRYRSYVAASVIPIGYVTSYGRIARAAGSEARAVGSAMAHNPLYPAVPCHRVVGSDYSLVGYGGRHDRDALSDKLARIESELKGAVRVETVEFPGGTLEVFPGEWVVLKSRGDVAPDSQLLLFG